LDKTKAWAFWLADQLLDSEERLRYEKSIKLRLITIHYGWYSRVREKSETHTQCLVGITDKEDVFADADIREYSMKRQVKKVVRVWSGIVWFILDFSSLLLSIGK
jgi:hypothetical protein